MKFYIQIFLLLIFSQTLFAIENSDDNIQTLLDSEDFESGGYGGPEIQLTKILDDLTIVVGGKGGWVINHTFVIGGAGYGVILNPQRKGYKNPYYPNDTRKYYLRAGWGGLYLEYINNHANLLHFTINTLIGAGAIGFTPSYSSMNHDYDSDDIIDYERSIFFIIEPTIGLEFNVLKFMKVELGASYRLTSGMNLKDFDPSQDFNGPTTKISFKFGNF